MTVTNQLKEDIITAVRLSYGWLREHDALVHSTSTHELNLALEWLISAWICEQGFKLGGDNAFSREGMIQVALRLNDYECSEAFKELFTCDVLRVVLAHNIAARHNVVSAPLGAFVGGLTASLKQPAEAAKDLYETRVIIALGELGQMPPTSSLDRLLQTSTLDLLQADESMIHHFATQVIAASAYGTRELQITQHLRQRLVDVMSVWLLDFARTYRLDSFSLVMRCLVYLGEFSAVNGAMRFVVAQHHPAGHFGFFGPETARAHQLSPTWHEAALLHLPMTFACLWALSECSDPSFRLLTSANKRIRSRAEPSQS